MKFLNQKIVRLLTVSVFSLALLFPAAVKFAHAFDSHEHKACTETSVHIHKKQLDCSICDFHFSLFNFNLQKLPEFAVFHGFQKNETVYFLPELQYYAHHYFLRGPPRLS
jgi:hypothetical protein